MTSRDHRYSAPPTLLQWQDWESSDQALDFDCIESAAVSTWTWSALLVVGVLQVKLLNKCNCLPGPGLRLPDGCRVMSGGSEAHNSCVQMFYNIRAYNGTSYIRCHRKHCSSHCLGLFLVFSSHPAAPQIVKASEVKKRCLKSSFREIQPLTT